jgi:NTE family protein
VAPLSLPRPIGFVFGGGGSLGAMQAGMLRAVYETDLRPDLVVGTSVGALNGALLADDPAHAVERLSALWPSVRREQVFPGKRWKQFATLRSARTFVFDSGALADFAARHLRADTFDQLQLPFGAVAVDATTADPVVLTSGLVVPAIVASTAIPGVYPPVWRNGRTLYDGGLVANVPMRQALALGARSLVVFDCSYPGRSWDPPDTMAEVLAWVLTVSARQQAALELPSVVKEVPVIYLPGPPLRRISPLDFTHTNELMEEAYEASQRFLTGLHVDGNGLYGSLYSPTTQVM